jgi:tetratricopeptide (TPR) repeat protein
VPAGTKPGRDDGWREVATVQALVAKSDLLYDDLDRAADALACVKTVLDEHRRAPTDQVRRAFIRSGELALAKGDREGATKVLEAAETAPEWKKPHGDFEVTGGAHSIDFEEALRQNELDAARREIASWEWERPTVLLSGQTRHLRGRVHLAAKRFELAALEFDRALARDPKAAFADEALFLEGLALEGLGRREKARACFERLVRELPESELVPRAKEKLK